MGADLYIKTLEQPVKAEWKPKFEAAVALRNAAQDDAAREAAQKLVDEAYNHLWGGDHYFRDSYNSTSVLWRLGLSWWQDLNPDITDEEAEVNCSPQLCRQFLEKVQAAHFTLPTRRELEDGHATVEDEGSNSVEGWHNYYTAKRDRLVAFLKRAIENGGMYASC